MNMINVIVLLIKLIVSFIFYCLGCFWSYFKIILNWVSVNGIKIFIVYNGMRFFVIFLNRIIKMMVNIFNIIIEFE